MPRLPFRSLNYNGLLFGWLSFLFLTEPTISFGQPELPLDGGFSYQGRLIKAGLPASGPHDFQFGLYNSATGGQQVAGTTTVSLTANVTEGSFSTRLNFGLGAFKGKRRWLEIRVGEAGSGANVQMDQRVEVGTTPQAEFALDSGSLGGAAAETYNKFRWVTLSADDWAEPNKGYVVSGHNDINLYLPFLSIGETVRVTNAGPGNVLIHHNTTQTIVATEQIPNTKAYFVEREAKREWRGIVSSNDGSKLMAFGRWIDIYTSNDFGLTWTPRSVPPDSGIFSSGAISADGTKLVVVENGGHIHTSSNSGNTWTARAVTRNWRSVASSADGNKLIACAGPEYVNPGGNVYQPLYVSNDSGITWSPKESPRDWYSVATSADGTKLTACVWGGQIYTSSNSGTTWVARGSNDNWRQVVSSANGTKLYAINGGVPYTSSDSGATWASTPNNWPAVDSLAMSDNGDSLVAAGYNSPVYSSNDGGQTWYARTSYIETDILTVGMSADGEKSFASADGGHLLLRPRSRALRGGPNTSIELQSIGDDQFLPISSSGRYQVD